MNRTGLFNLSWERYLNLLFLLLTVGFLSSGVVTFIAANWDYLSDLTKIYGLQTLFVFSVMTGGYFFMRESRQLAAEKLKLFSVALFFSAAVLIGAILALAGQTYQTGANTWELFAIWSVCQIPWLLLLPNVASALLLIITANLALYLLQIDNYDYVAVYGVFLNGVGLVFSEVFTRRLHDERWRILPKILLGFVIIHLFGIRFMAYGTIFDTDFGWFSVLNFLIVSVPSAALFYFYKQYRFDFTNLIASALGIIVAFSMLLFSHINSADSVFSSGLLIFVLTILAMKYLYKLYQARYPQQTKMPWALSVLFIFAILIGMVTAIIWAAFILDISDPLLAVLALAIAMLLTALGLHRAYPQASNEMSLVVGMCFLMGYGLLGGYLWFDHLERDPSETTQIFVPLLFSCVVGVFYFVRKEVWLQTLTVVSILSMWHLSYVEDIASGALSLPYLCMLCCVCVFVGQFLWMIKHQQSEAVTPLAWGLLFFSIGSWMYSASQTFFPWFHHFSEVADELPSIDTFSDFFSIITYGIFSRATLTFSWWVPFFVCLTPFSVYWVISLFFKSALAEKWFIAIVLMLFTIGFVAQPSILFFVALWLIAYFSASRSLFFIALLALITNLALYYYMLFIPLLYKSFLLLCFGALFSFVVFFLHRKSKVTTQSAVDFSGVSKCKPLMALLIALLMLLPLNYKIWQFENVLATGKPVVLKIVPVDPRSLMQGDYMSLNYAILQDIAAQLNDEPDQLNDEQTNEEDTWQITRKPQPKRIYALIHQNEQGVATLCRVEKTKPMDFTDCEPNLYLPINNTGWSPALPSQEYFFAEGKGQYYAQAEYAEYRFKDGILLLARLLDKDLKPL